METRVGESARRFEVRGRRALRGGRLTPYLFMAPGTVLVILFFVAPAVLIVLMSLTNMTTATGFDDWRFVGLENYSRILIHPNSILIVQATALFVAVTLGLFNIGLGLLLALLTTHIPRRAGFFFRALWLLPRITPVVVYVLVWKYIAAPSPYGVLNEHLLVPFMGGQGNNLLPEFPWTFVVLISGFVGASFGMIIFTSAIEAIPRDYMNAALVDGAGPWQRIRYVVLPSLKWPLLFVTTYQTLSLLTTFEYIFAMTGGNFGTTVWSLWAYETAFSSYFGNFQYGFGAALAVLLVLVGVVASFVYMRFFRFRELVTRPRIEDVRSRGQVSDLLGDRGGQKR
ncbi:MAG: carbohydrate ABC transporter permease [Actinomycetota bacterium]